MTAIRRRLLALAGAVPAVTLGVVAQAFAGSGAEAVDFGMWTCAPGWPTPNPGLDRFAIANHSNRRATVYLFESDSGAIVSEVTALAPGTVAVLSARLSPGQAYAWSCDLDGVPVHLSDARIVPREPQAGGPGPTHVPVVAAELIGPLKRYRGYVERLLGVERRRLAVLVHATDGGSLQAARIAWLAAHETWLELGQDDGAYGAFGELGRAIDGTAAGLVGGVRSARFTGFHRVELDLWGGRARSAAADAARLAALVGTLDTRRVNAALPATTAGLDAWVLRCHEILEDALRDTLSGDDDYGSHSFRASLLADVAATREMLDLLAPVITPRAPYLVARARTDLVALAHASAPAGGLARPIAALPRAERERLEAMTDAALETIAPVSELTELGNT